MLCFAYAVVLNLIPPLAQRQSGELRDIGESKGLTLLGIALYLNANRVALAVPAV